MNTTMKASNLTSRVIPCLDVKDGRVVKGVRFTGLKDSGDPVELAARYEQQGADELVFLDISATPEGRATHAMIVAKIREVLSIPLTTGGGVRSIESARVLLEAGADKVATNTAAVDNPQLINELSQTFGSQCTILAIDAAAVGENKWEVVTRSGANRTGIDAIEWAIDAEKRGAGEILLTSWDRDGTRAGYDLELLSQISKNVRIPIIASGGANSAQHLIEALEVGANAVLAASIFHEGEYTVAQIKNELSEKGIKVRLC